MTIPFSQYVEYVTVEGVFHVDMTQHELGSPLTLAALNSGYTYTTELGREYPLEHAQVDAIKVKLEPDYHSDLIEYSTLVPEPPVIIQKLVEVKSRPDWKVGMAVAIGDVYAFTDKNLYRCVQAHTTQSDWIPPITPALWVKFYDPESGPQPWVQPAGAHDAYALGAQVTHNGHLWESLIDANVWEPGTAGTSGLWADLGVYP